MATHRLRALALFCLCLAPPAARADPAADLAARIDARVEQALADRKITPAPLADDAELFRRLHLDLAGRVPPAAEVRKFLASNDPDKRRQAVESLLGSPAYLTHFTGVWRAALLPETGSQQARLLAVQFDPWLREQLRDNTPHDVLVRGLLTVSLDPARRGGGAADTAGLIFFRLNENKPENLAGATTRLFLGVRLECAQCHDHPFARWKRTDFWQFAAFFAGVQPANPRAGGLGPIRDDPRKREIAIPGGERVVQARFLGGAEPQWDDETTTRAVLARWVTAPESPYFARATVNRVWGHFFGLGLVDPVDDFGDENPASHPELLDDLARAFVAQKYDLRFLFRAITLSKTYQRTSARTHPSQDDPRSFARMAIKGLTAEQLFDSLCQATGFRDQQPGADRRGFVPQGSIRGEFLNRFASTNEKRTEHQTSILQALALMNGRLTADVTSLQTSQTLAAIVDAPFLDTRGRLDALFLAALSRPMRPGEADRFVPYVEKGGPSGDQRQALADVFWALLNSTEFSVNH
jgi:hypothetical protein